MNRSLTGELTRFTKDVPGTDYGNTQSLNLGLNGLGYTQRTW